MAMTAETPTERADAGEETAEQRLERDALDRLSELVPALLERDAQAEGAVDESWVRGVLAGIRLDARAGRRIPIEAGERADLGITEGAVRGIIRACEDRVPGALIGRCQLDGDVTEPGAPIRVEVDVSALYGAPIVPLAERLRAEIGQALAAHTPLAVAAIDISVRDVQLPGPASLAHPEATGGSAS
ncbi:Asp23/Gls24 family envelope stress response protein [Leucobacter aridicollis]|nr:Asp23/Gls24 family envelope stress response protein [Leucobacter aridicollis]